MKVQFNTAAFMAGKNKNFENFDDWYVTWKGGARHESRSRRSSHRTRKRPTSRSYTRDERSSPSAGELIGSAAQTLIEAVDTVIKKKAAPTPSAREKNFRKKQRRLQHYERKYESRKKSVVVLGLIAGGMLILPGVNFSMAVIVGLIAGYQYYSASETLKKVNRYREELEALEYTVFPEEHNEAERHLLQHAYNNDGKVYPEVLALESDFALAEIEHVLAICVDKHIASIELDDRGRTYYYFSSFDQTDPWSELENND